MFHKNIWKKFIYEIDSPAFSYYFHLINYFMYQLEKRIHYKRTPLQRLNCSVWSGLQWSLLAVRRLLRGIIAKDDLWLGLKSYESFCIKPLIFPTRRRDATSFACITRHYLFWGILEWLREHSRYFIGMVSSCWSFIECSNGTNVQAENRMREIYPFSVWLQKNYIFLV